MRAPRSDPCRSAGRRSGSCRPLVGSGRPTAPPRAPAPRPSCRAQCGSLRPCQTTLRAAPRVPFAVMPEFAFQELLPVDHNDATPYRLLTSEHVSTFDAAGQRFLRVEPDGAHPAHPAGHVRHRPLLAARSPRSSCGPSSTTPRPRPTTGSSPSTCSRTPTSPPAGSCRCARTRARRSSWARRASGSSPAATTRRRSAAGVYETYHTRQPPLLADRPAHDVGRDQHRQQPAGADRDLRDGRATTTSSCSWPRAAARPTRATSSRRPRPC